MIMQRDIDDNTTLQIDVSFETVTLETISEDEILSVDYTFEQLAEMVKQANK